MYELQTNDCGTDPIRDAANRARYIETGADGTRRVERNSSPAFENWLIKYRYQLAKVLEGKTTETGA